MLYILIQSLALFSGLAAATTVQAWNGGACNGDAGSKATVFVHGSCIKLSGRRSIEADGDNVKGYFYSAEGCQGASTAFTASNRKCKAIGSYGSMCIVGSGNSGCGYS